LNSRCRRALGRMTRQEIAPAGAGKGAFAFARAHRKKRFFAFDPGGNSTDGKIREVSSSAGPGPRDPLGWSSRA